MPRYASLSFGVVVAVALCLGLVVIAQANGSENNRAELIHVGQNPNSCGIIDGDHSGEVNIHVNTDRRRFKVNVSVHDALPNTTYVVDIRCVGAIGSLTTNSRGTGRAEIDLSRHARPSNSFFIDISVFNGATYGDTFISGPFDLN